MTKTARRRDGKTARHEEPGSDLPPGLSQPAARALRAAGYTRLEELVNVPAAELGTLHGMGPKALATIRAALEARGLAQDRDDEGDR